MSFTNSTPNYGLPQYIGTDKPTYLGDMNTAYSTIDTQMKANADAAVAATSTANNAASTATTASTNATTALNTANSAASEAASATSAAASATSTANTASTNASAALRASAANTIENLAPAYDPTLTYSVGDLVTYIDENNSGKLYKCIVAVGTPEAFNINKWDDVTTSEVYAPSRKLVAQYTCETTDTYGEIEAAIANQITIDTNKRYELDIVSGTLVSPSVLHVLTPTRMEFVSIGMSIAGNLNVQRWTIEPNNNAAYNGTTDISVGSPANVTTTNNTNVAAGSVVTLKLYEI